MPKNKRARNAALAIIEHQKQLIKAKAAAADKPKKPVKSHTSGSASASASRSSTTGASSSIAPRSSKGASLPFAFGETILLIGEGNFTFARALARNKQLFSDSGSSHASDSAGRLIATSYDSADDVKAKYSVSDSILTELTTTFSPFCTVLHGVDARALSRDRRLANIRPNHIVFNFPHEGRGVHDEVVSVARHRDLLVKFFQSAIDLIIAQDCADTTFIHVTVKRGKPYDLWNVVELARNAVEPRLKLSKTYHFQPSLYEGYTHGLTRGDDPAEADMLDGALCVTYVFAIRDEAAHQAASEERKKALKRSGGGRPRPKSQKEQKGASRAVGGGWRKRNRKL